jgi:hypothetical protein
MIFDAAETVLGYFGFDRTLYGDKKNISKRKWWWMQELRQEKDIKIEMSKESKAMSFYSHNCYCSLTASQSFQLSHGISTNHHKKHCILRIRHETEIIHQKSFDNHFYATLV